MGNNTTMDDLLGTCQNAFWDGWNNHRAVNFRYCEQPAMALFGDRSGIRNLCAACGSKSGMFFERESARIVEAFDVAGAAKWLARSHARYVDQSLFAYEWAALGKPLAEVRKHQAWADTTGKLITLMTRRWANEIRAAIRAGHIVAADIGLTAADLEPVTTAGVR